MEAYVVNNKVESRLFSGQINVVDNKKNKHVERYARVTRK